MPRAPRKPLSESTFVVFKFHDGDEVVSTVDWQLKELLQWARMADCDDLEMQEVGLKALRTAAEDLVRVRIGDQLAKLKTGGRPKGSTKDDESVGERTLRRRQAARKKG